MTNRESNEPINSSWWLLCWRTLKHPATGSAVGVVGLISGFLFYESSRAEKVPVYAVSPTEVLAASGDLSSNLGIYWQGKQVPNVCLKRIALWNEGSLPITSSDLPEADPLRLVPSKTVDILFVQVAGISRRRLKFATRIVTDAESKRPVVYLGIVGGDGLEKMDGGELQVVYSGDRDTEFRVEGRVVGVPGGFTRKLVGRQTTSSPRGPNRWISLLIIAPVLLGSPYILYAGVRRLRSQRIVFGWLYIGMSAVYFSSAIWAYRRLGAFVLPTWISFQ